MMHHSLLQNCVLLAIKHGHLHIANHIRCDNYSTAFHSVFPDGLVPAQFFSQLLNPECLSTDVGEQIASELIAWLPTQNIQKIRQMIEEDSSIPFGVLKRFDTMYGDYIDQRDYPCDYD